MAPFEQQVTFLYVADLEHTVTFHAEHVGLAQPGCTIRDRDLDQPG